MVVVVDEEEEAKEKRTNSTIEQLTARKVEKTAGCRLKDHYHWLDIIKSNFKSFSADPMRLIQGFVTYQQCHYQDPFS